VLSFPLNALRDQASWLRSHHDVAIRALDDNLGAGANFDQHTGEICATSDSDRWIRFFGTDVV
jgi:hypothetical protein